MHNAARAEIHRATRQKVNKALCFIKKFFCFLFKIRVLRDFGAPECLSRQNCFLQFFWISKKKFREFSFFKINKISASSFRVETSAKAFELGNSCGFSGASNGFSVDFERFRLIHEEVPA